jgi:diaminopimelate decarboxylase
VTLFWPFENHDGELFIDNASSLSLARQYGTPLYVYSENKIRLNVNTLREALKKNYPKTRILYACKANTNLSVLKVLRNEDVEIDAVSPGEVYIALQAGFKPEEILFTGTSVSDDEMNYLLEEGVRMNIDSISQMRKLLGSTTPETVSLRVNPEVGAGHHEHVITAGPDVKFGVWESQALEAYQMALDAGVESFGIQMHIGSGIMDVENYIKAVGRLLEIARHIHDAIWIDFSFIDLGGGIGVAYRPEEKPMNLDEFIGALFDFIKEKLAEYSLGLPEVWLEPGRYLVAESGVILTGVTTLKSSPGRVFVGVDAGFNTLIRPVLYGSYHHILNASSMNNPSQKYDVYGPLCESGDLFARDRDIAEVSEGDVLAIMNAGAYGFSMSSNYNSRPRPAEVLVMAGESRLVRRRETLEDLFKGQGSNEK